MILLFKGTKEQHKHVWLRSTHVLSCIGNTIVNICTRTFQGWNPGRRQIPYEMYSLLEPSVMRLNVSETLDAHRWTAISFPGLFTFKGKALGTRLRWTKKLSRQVLKVLKVLNFSRLCRTNCIITVASLVGGRSAPRNPLPANLSELTWNHHGQENQKMTFL